MLALIILMIFGLGTAYFATQNTGVVHIMFGTYLFSGVPLYVIVVGSILLGVFVSWLVNIVDTFSSTRVMYGKDSALKKASQTIDQLRAENHDLEMENAHLKGEMSGAKTDEQRRREINTNPSFLERVRHNFS